MIVVEEMMLVVMFYFVVIVIVMEDVLVQHLLLGVNMNVNNISWDSFLLW